MNAQDFINSVATGNAAEAKDTLNDLLSARAFEALEAKKIEIAQNLFNGKQEAEEEGDTEAA
jgi:thymidine phosphorylase